MDEITATTDVEQDFGVLYARKKKEITIEKFPYGKKVELLRQAGKKKEIILTSKKKQGNYFGQLSQKFRLSVTTSNRSACGKSVTVRTRFLLAKLPMLSYM